MKTLAEYAVEAAPQAATPSFWREVVPGLPPFDPAKYALALEDLWRGRGVCTCPAGQPCRRVAELMQEGTDTLGCVGGRRVQLTRNAGQRGADRDDKINARRIVADPKDNLRVVAKDNRVDLNIGQHLTISIVGCDSITIEARGRAVMARPRVVPA